MIHSLSEEAEVRLEAGVADGALAHLEVHLGVVVHVVDAHLVRDGVAAHGDVGSWPRVVGARCDESISLRQDHIM